MAKTNKNPKQSLSAREQQLFDKMSAVPRSTVAELLGRHRNTLGAWKRDPSFATAGIENPDGTWNFISLLRWREAKAQAAQENMSEKGELQLEKLRKDIEIKNITIENYHKTMMPLADHKEILQHRYDTLSGFLTFAFVQNAHKFAGKTLDQLRIMAADFARQTLAVWTGRDDKPGSRRKR